MAKNRIKTPNLVLEGKEKSKKSKTFKVKFCPDCGSDDVSIVLENEEGKGKGKWQCGKCKWKGTNIQERELNEEEFMKYSSKMEI